MRSHLRGWTVVAALALAAAASGVAAERRYTTTLREMCDALLSTQITAPDAADRGALVCPSTNPQPHPLHSRAGEAVYPLAIVFRETREAKYRDAAILLGDWMVGKQQPRGAWGEDWPRYDGWAGTTSDQLISLAGAYPLLRDALTGDQRARWEAAMTAAADYIEKSFPVGNINYQPTGAVALWFAGQAVAHPRASWAAKADALMALTVRGINADGLLAGEGNGVDLGYNLAQSIGYMALYGRLTGNEALRRRAADLLRVHETFVYPNGTVDNSWGTRSFKWTYESGTKTAPGVYFTFALLADEDPSFAPAGRLCFEHLTRHAITQGFVQYGPAAERHASTEPPCLYSTFVRAQSLALAIAYGAEPGPGSAAGLIPAQRTNWFRFFPTVNVAVVRTAKLMATLSNYGAISRYGRGQVSRGGSVTNLWIEGFGDDGMAQTSSVTVYKREEPAHMPIEGDLRPLTPRIEATLDGGYYTNLFEAAGTMTAQQRPDCIEVTTTGRLRSQAGDASPVAYRITHRFYAEGWTKTFELTGPSGVAISIVEPFVKHAGMRVTPASDKRVTIAFDDKRTWALAAGEANATVHLGLGADAAKYWCPFPAVECVPVVANFVTKPGGTHVELEFGR